MFFPLGLGNVVSTPRETTQPNLESLQYWASGLDSVYLEGALVRALEASGGIVMPESMPDVTEAEMIAASDAVALHRDAVRAADEAASELLSATLHEDAGATARENAARLSARHDELEQLANETARATAEATASAHEAAAREARAVAADIPRKSPTSKRSRKRSTPKKRG